MGKELLLGCGNRREKVVTLAGDKREWDNLTTLDIDPASKPDVLHDLNVTPWPFEDNTFSEIHAYEVLEHLGQQGDYKSFFAHFYEIWRILKPNGMLFATCPGNRQTWTWGDPGHTRMISAETITFLDQEQYKKQVGHSGMTDYRWCWKGDLYPLHAQQEGESFFVFILRARKGTNA